MSFRQLAKLATVAGLVVGAAAAQAADPVRIGYSLGRTGILASGVSTQEQAYILWQEELNARGGLDIGGKEKRKIEFVSYDDQSDAGKIPQIYDKLINDDKVDLLLAPYATYLHVAITGVIEKNRVSDGRQHRLVRCWCATSTRNTCSSPNLLPDARSRQLVDFLKAQNVKRVRHVHPPAVVQSGDGRNSPSRC